MQFEDAGASVLVMFERAMLAEACNRRCTMLRAASLSWTLLGPLAPLAVPQEEAASAKPDQQHMTVAF